MSHRAKSRHQLSTLLTDAYAHRAELEDKIATVDIISCTSRTADIFCV